MPVDHLEIHQIREALTSPDTIARNGFSVLANIARLTNEGNAPQESQELVLRALEVRRQFGNASLLLDAVVRQVGLFPYLNPNELGTPDQIAYEFNRPANMPEQIVFHEPQARVYRALLRGHNVVLSAPTSFGKSLVTDAVIASGKFKNVLIVVPTIALMDETRRRLSQRFRGQFKIITHVSQALTERNVFVLTQERVLERDLFKLVELVVVDEFYKLSPPRKSSKEEDSRCARLTKSSTVQSRHRSSSTYSARIFSASMRRLLRSSSLTTTTKTTERLFRRFTMLGPVLIGLRRLLIFVKRWLTRRSYSAHLPPEQQKWSRPLFLQ